MRAYLGEMTLEALIDETGPLVYVRLPGTRLEVSVSDGYDIGPLALVHDPEAPTWDPPVLPVDYDDVDAVEVYRVTTELGDILFPASIVPVMPASARAGQKPPAIDRVTHEDDTWSAGPSRDRK